MHDHGVPPSPEKDTTLAINPLPDAVFIHVSDVQNAISWYSRLLDLPVGDLSHGGMIYDLPVGGGTGIILDGYPKAASQRGTGPRVMFSTGDIAAARRLATTLSHEVSELQDIGSSLVFYLEDPDGNLLCIRQPKA